MRTSRLAAAIIVIAVVLFSAGCGASATPSSGSGDDIPPIADLSNFDPNRPRVDFLVVPACNVTPGFYDFQASWTPADFSIYRVDRTGYGIIGNCGDVVNGTISCMGVEADPDGYLHLSFVHRNEDISEITYEVEVPAPDCLAPPDSGDVDNFGNFGWRIRSVGCYQTGQIEFEVLTNVTNPNFISACHTATECRGMYHVYTCTMAPSRPGIVYCTGDRPGNDEFLHLCIRTRASEGINCQDFPDFIDDVRDCSQVVPLTITETPETPPQSLPACSSYATYDECKSQFSRCAWSTNDPNNGKCQDKP